MYGLQYTYEINKDTYKRKQSRFREYVSKNVFNVFAHNRDDHAKNFSFLYDEQTDGWRLSPAYDLTYSNTYFGEHTTSVDGNGVNPGEKEIINVGVKAGMKKKDSIFIMEQVRECILKDLKEVLSL